MLLLIDFEKAFDSVAWSFIEKVFKYFNFKNDIIQWIKTFYTDIKSTVIVNGNPTLWFPIHRGCRQGDPISPYIFLICSEVLAHMIRQNENIKGYNFLGKETKINQFADDTSLFLDGSQKSFEYCIYTILEYAKYSGLSMNFDKTKVVWFGCENPPDTVYLPHLKFDWNPAAFSILGVDFTTDLKDITDININKRITTMTIEMNQWSKRDLTPLGRITVLKTLIISKIVHLLISLPNPSDKLLKELNSIFYSFIWKGRPDKIKRTTSRQKLIDGGLGMTDIKSFNNALKLTWIRRLFNSKAKWKTLLELRSPCLFEIHKFGNTFINNTRNNINNQFWKDVMTAFSSFNEKYYQESDTETDFCSFLYNDKIKIGNDTIRNKILRENNIFYIHQLKDNNKFLSHREFETKYIIKINFLNYNSIISAVKNFQSKFPIQSQPKKLERQPHFDFLMKNTKGASHIYQFLLSEKGKNTGQIKWNTINDIDEEQWRKSFYILKTTTSDTKLQWFQIRLLHYILTTNRSVSKFMENQSDLCEFCGSHSETIQHVMWHCPRVQLFWNDLSNILKSRCPHIKNLVFNENLILFGQCSTIIIDKICQLIILMAKFSIYRSKVQKTTLNLRHFIKEIYHRYNVEMHIHDNSEKFQLSWTPYSQLFKSLM